MRITIVVIEIEQDKARIKFGSAEFTMWHPIDWVRLTGAIRDNDDVRIRVVG